jgi:hypothetical protein
MIILSQLQAVISNLNHDTLAVLILEIVQGRERLGLGATLGCAI